MVMQYSRITFRGDAIVVAFDICSSSDIIEELTLKGDMERFRSFLKKIKHYLADAQKIVLFDPYKFTGDGWILLFPPDTDGQLLLTFLRNFAKYYKKTFRTVILKYLDTPPAITGINFGIEKGALTSMIMYGGQEYIGRAINIACRLQSAIKDKGGSPAYKALVSNVVYINYFSPATGYKVISVTRVLRNIRGGALFKCKKINLLPTSKST